MLNGVRKDVSSDRMWYELESRDSERYEGTMAGGTLLSAPRFSLYFWKYSAWDLHKCGCQAELRLVVFFVPFFDSFNCTSA